MAGGPSVLTRASSSEERLLPNDPRMIAEDVLHGDAGSAYAAALHGWNAHMDLALFDFDGTITTGDTYTPFLGYVSPAAFRRRAWRQLLWPWLGYKLGFVSGTAVRRLVTAHVLRGR